MKSATVNGEWAMVNIVLAGNTYMMIDAADGKRRTRGFNMNNYDCKSWYRIKSE